MTNFTDNNKGNAVDNYLINLPEEQRVTLENLRKIIKTTAPEAEEFISYKMPAYKFHGMLCSFAAFKNHCSFYPWNATTVEQFKDELKEFSLASGTIRFTPEKPIPEALLKKIIQARMNENLNKSKKIKE
ncbi:DUF1801 domain-containing protein [Flavobacterium sp. LB2P84]|jgi:uncharacterized protein YdhG (YjbR/CyaY superfamily)|uniref:iron chaperone n=1 Tax=Flavobacterium yafengii TaxID=3041253 RepID=UPI0024A9AC04|nr:DUF1801 domain-containing protein [Flavobacterium yafengii]MDI6032906.1 DUF1801 domain-containing protein [Flavobacterium yafengii]